MWRRWGAGAVIFLCTGCGDNQAADPTHPSVAPPRNVMVIDEGIDLSSPDLRGKVAAAFTAVCGAGASGDAGQATPADGGDGDGGASDGDAGAPSFEVLKRNYIARLGIPNDSCQLQPGISAKEDPLAGIARFRERWNGMIRGQHWGKQVFSETEWNEITSALTPGLAAFPFHGTSTASTAAHDNPGVHLVLIERRLADPTKVLDNFTCLVQAELDQTVALLSDPDVREAYVHSPESQYTKTFFEVIHQFNVGLVSLSFGSASRQKLDLLQQMKGCPGVDTRPYFHVLHDLRVASLAVAPPKPYLVIQSAGNDSQILDSGDDSTNCTPEDSHLLTVGSTTLVDTPSRFSNTGGCVGVFAPGEQIIAPYAGGWLFVDRGTSFAAPLVTRFLSLSAAVPFDAPSARAALLARLAPGETLSFASIPRDFFYAPDGPAATVSALVTTTDPRANILRSLASVDFEPVLAPLLLTRRAAVR
jgi:hypothetical protein